MRSYTAAAQRYAVSVVAIAMALSAYHWLYTPLPALRDLLPFGLLTALAAVAELYPVHSARGSVRYVVANVFTFAAAVILPAPLLALHCLLGLLPWAIMHRKQPATGFKWAFNFGQLLISAQAARWLFSAFGWTGFDGPVSLMVMLGAVVSFALLQGVLVALMIHFSSGVPVLTVDALDKDALLLEGILGLMGAVVAVLWQVQPWSLALLPLPLIATYTLMRRVELIRMADLDPKTGVYNSRYLDEMVKQELIRTRPSNRSTALLFMDLDYLRHINNRYGHLAGDYVLKEVAGVMARQLRAGDLLARFGGEEFVAMLPGADRSEAIALAERLRQAVAEHPFRFEDQSIRVTVSIGVVACPVDGTELNALVRRADELLYAAKAQGRNRVAAAGMPEHEAAVPAQMRREARSHAEPAAADPAAGPAAARAVGPSATAGPPAEQGAAAPPTSSLAVVLPWPVAAAGALIGAWAAAHTPWPYPRPYHLGVLAVLVIVAELLKVQVYEGNREKISISLSQGAMLAAAVMLDLPGALLVGSIGSLTHLVLTRRPDAEKIAFNLGSIWLSTAAAYGVYARFSGGRGGVSAISSEHLFGAALAALTFYAVNSALVNLVIALRSHRTLLAVWRENIWFAPAFLFLGLTGAFLGACYEVVGWAGAIVFLAPICMLRYCFTLYAGTALESIAELKQAKEDVEAANLEKEQTLDQLILTISAIIDARDRSVYGHSYQVARYSVALAEEMGLTPEVVQRIRIAALLHDLGKIGISEGILHKPGRLTADEYAVIQRHAGLGAEILSQVRALEDVARMVGEHHERFGGGGYPDGKAGEEITIGGRIIAVADTMDTILSDRPYARARPLSRALEEVRRCSGEQFDPQVVDALLRLATEHDGKLFVNSANAGGDKVHTLFTVEGAAS